VSREEANRFNVLDQHYFFDSAVALLGPQRKEFLRHYKFDVAPTTDDRPYFFDFFKWQALPELLERRTLGGAALLDWGYAVLVATLVQASVLALVLILTPLLGLGGHRPQAAAAALARWRIAVYFLAIGFAFLFVEIASIQRFVLFLGHPVYAIPVVLCAFLFFAGIGSGFAPRLTARLDALQGLSSPGALIRFTAGDRRRRWVVRVRHPALALAVAGIVAAAVLHLVAAPPLFRWLMPLPDALKIAVSLVLIAPLAFFMGLPFPLALVRVAAARPGLVPWAWGINGCASVLSAILAILLAMSLGFSAVLLFAIGLYLVAAATLR
jgi:hypothetical protein